MKKIKIGVFGARRGMDIATYFMMQDCEVVALCERRKDVAQNVMKKLPSTAVLYEDFDEFIKFLTIFDHVIFLIRIFSKVNML